MHLPKLPPQQPGRGPVAYIVSMGSGLEAFIYRELEALEEMGIEVVLFATKFAAHDVYSPKSHWKYVTAPLLTLILQAPLLALRAIARPSLLAEAIRDGGLVDLMFALRYAPEMRRMGIQQIHSHFGDHKLFIGHYCKRILGVPLSVTIHAHEFYTNPNPKLFSRALDSCDAIFPIAQRWIDRLKSEYQIPAKKLILNRLFVDTSLYRPKTFVTVLAVGRFTPRKGFQHLLEAAVLLAKENVRFIFVGFGSLDVEGTARKLGVAQRVTVFGKMDQAQLRVIYQSADILCVPSITTEDEGAEGIPVVLMEGMACGLPVVATRCGAIDEIVTETLVDEGSAEQLAEGIRVLATDAALRLAQGERNRLRVQQEYSDRNVKAFANTLVNLSVATGRSTDV